MRLCGEAWQYLLFKRQCYFLSFGAQGNKTVIVSAAIPEPLPLSGESHAGYNQYIQLLRCYNG